MPDDDDYRARIEEMRNTFSEFWLEKPQRKAPIGDFGVDDKIRLVLKCVSTK
jgi:hypothetical protein